MNNELNSRNYYDGYEQRGFSLTLDDMWMAMVWLMNIPEKALRHTREKEKARFLVLGSATPSNLTYISKIDGYVRPGKISNDTITIIDQNFYPLTKHAQLVRVIEGNDGWSNTPVLLDGQSYPRFELIQGDIKKLPFNSNTFDVVVSDFTLNYLTSISDLEKTFEDVTRVLCQKGLCILAVRGNQKYPYQKHRKLDFSPSEAEVISLGRVNIHVFPLETYMAIAKDKGLKVICYFISVNDIYAFFIKK
jgi:hypothetical protein